ncbi:MAG TPA: hypothetical protein VGQ35_08920 [Dongiaceae bacterium]|jgi:hypothetical protein|nr:hypothetical protein [Dongiaceae bacterium]
MSAKRALAPIALSSLMLGALSSDAMSQSSSELLSDPTPFEIAYGMSFYDFDACGDAEAGRILRRAIIEKLELCPFSTGAREEFQKWRLETLEDMAMGLWQAHVQGKDPGGPAELYDWQTNPPRPLMTCSEYRQTPRYLEKRGRLLSYARSEIGVDQAIGEECPSGPASL